MQYQIDKKDGFIIVECNRGNIIETQSTLGSAIHGMEVLHNHDDKHGYNSRYVILSKKDGEFIWVGNDLYFNEGVYDLGILNQYKGNYVDRKLFKGKSVG